jgi:TPR repeat protein
MLSLMPHAATRGATRCAFPLSLSLAGLLFGLACIPSAAVAETRRAFLVGVERYSDGNIQQLTRTVNDAKDLAKDLEEAGFDKKNIKVVTDPKTKEGFDKEFNAFLKTVEPGDTVVFFFSGHGFGIEADQTNYLLLGDLKSPFAFARAQMPEKERKNADVIRLRIPSLLDAYQQNEIPKGGVSATEIEQRISERKPKTVIMILDACRSLVTAGPADPKDPKRLKRGDDSGSRLVTSHKPPANFVVLYSASFGEQAVERFGPLDQRRNSLFTEVLRSELQRPGQTLPELGERVKLMVRAIAQNEGQQQEPEVVHTLENPDEFAFVSSIGRERFQLTQDRCDQANEDWTQIKDLRKRDLYDRHRRRFDACPTAELARRAIARLGLSPEETAELTGAGPDRSVNECDRLAASELDPARPPEIRGVPFEKIDGEAAVEACQKAVQENPRIARYLFNLARAYQHIGSRPGIEEAEKRTTMRRARLAYEDAARRGYVSALNNLAVLYEAGDGIEINEDEAANLFKRAAQQGHPLGMYNLALHYRDGTSGIKRDLVQAYEWFAKAAEAGFVPAMVELGDALRYRLGLRRSNPRLGVEWYQRAADAGMARAKLQLGLTYLLGAADIGEGSDGSNTIRPDPTLALLWLGRVAESGEPVAQRLLAMMMEEGVGLPSHQPEIAERYWRLAAHGGDRLAEVEFADRQRRELVLVKQEYGENEAVLFLRRALSQGSPQAALALAQIYRTGELGQERRPLEAMKLAYRAIDLSLRTDPTTNEGSPFHEIAAGHLLVEMAKNGEAVDAAGRPLLTQDEVDRLERYYGAVDPSTKTVKIRRLNVPLGCWGWNVRDFMQGRPTPGWFSLKAIWVWDWGRNESPTEAQFRNLERDTKCTSNELLRRTLIDVFEQAKKNKVPFADLADQKIKTAKLAVDEPNTKKRGKR